MFNPTRAEELVNQYILNVLYPFVFPSVYSVLECEWIYNYINGYTNANIERVETR